MGLTEWGPVHERPHVIAAPNGFAEHTPPKCTRGPSDEQGLPLAGGISQVAHG